MEANRFKKLIQMNQPIIYPDVNTFVDDFTQQIDMLNSEYQDGDINALLTVEQTKRLYHTAVYNYRGPHQKELRQALNNVVPYFHTHKFEPIQYLNHVAENLDGQIG